MTQNEAAMTKTAVDTLAFFLFSALVVAMLAYLGDPRPSSRAPAPLTPARPLLVLPNTPEGFLVFEGVLRVPPETRAVEVDGTEHREDGGRIAIEREARIDFIYNPQSIWVLDF